VSNEGQHGFEPGYLWESQVLVVTGCQDIADLLYCTVLYCTALYYTVLYCTLLYCTVL
jgi:hypothetical protein